MRINAPSVRPTLAGNDLDVVLQSAGLQALVLPKVEQAADVAFVAERAAAANNTYVVREAQAMLTTQGAACARALCRERTHPAAPADDHRRVARTACRAQELSLIHI